MADSVSTLAVVMKPPRWSGGLPMLMMCDQNGEPLPGQVACQVTTHADGTLRAVVTFDIDSDSVVLSGV